MIKMNIVESFTFNRMPRIIFGTGKIAQLGSTVKLFGNRVLLVRGSSSLKKSDFWNVITGSLQSSGISFWEYEITGEPSPQSVDTAVQLYFDKSIDCIVSIGGGSVIDAGKAISAMMPHGNAVTEFLEVVGKRKPDGEKIPFIAVPTTSGTGSEASANAVLSEIGPNGFKRSLRHENYVPDAAIVDPELSMSCPPQITAACGMDAFTQLLESYVSPKASPFTDALVESALPLVSKHLTSAAFHGTTDINARSGMAYSSLVSGISLMNAGLGVVHGLASVIGAKYPIPHGVICGSLLSSAVDITINKLIQSENGTEAVKKYAKAAKLMLKAEGLSDIEACKKFIDYIESLSNQLSMPFLSDFGVDHSFVEHIPNENVNKNNPIQLSNNEIKLLLLKKFK